MTASEYFTANSARSAPVGFSGSVMSDASSPPYAILPLRSPGNDMPLMSSYMERTILLAEKMGSYHMIPGQTAIYEKGSNICKVMTNAYYKEASDWKDNKLIFRNAPLGEVLTTLSRQFDVSFDVRSKEINKFTYNFTCKLNNLSGIFEMMSAITPIKFNEISENVYAVKEK